ncbi:MAG: glycoside hydrolase family 2 [Clostridia bacterium]|nr:glycoside hydrolase family 2 [Clostridia bacterium]
MKTRWTDSVNVDAPLQEYPRPQLKRYLWTNLNGQYDCTINDNFENLPEKFDMRITVPFAVESPLSGVEKGLQPGEILWYRRYFELDSEYEDKRVLLHFGAVDWECKVFVNGKMVGGHTGGYIPFYFDITDYLVDAQNELIVGVFDPTDAGLQQMGKQTLHPSSIFYTPTSGIWQTVWLEGVNDYFVRKVTLTPDIDKGCLSIDVDTNDEKSSHKIFATIYDIDETEIFSGEVSDVDVINLPSFKLWSPEKPNLYNIMFELFVDDVLYDTVVSYFGMRKFSVMKDASGVPRLALNNKIYFQSGLLDQGYWPDGGMTAPTDEALSFDIKVLKSLGFNMIRKHIKIEPLRWYYHCDRLGMIVWQDMVSGGKHFVMTHDFDAYEPFGRDDPDNRQIFYDELDQMMDLLHNCVSIGCWVPFNEGWGQFDTVKIAQRVKAADPSRILDHASGWHDKGVGDLKSIHDYALVPKYPKSTEGRVFVLSEYGGYGRIVSGHMFFADESKYNSYSPYEDKKAISEAYEKLIEKTIVPMIRKGLSATVYTQVTDVEGEINGLMTYDREIIKIEGDSISRMNKAMYAASPENN